MEKTLEILAGNQLHHKLIKKKQNARKRAKAKKRKQHDN